MRRLMWVLVFGGWIVPKAFADGGIGMTPVFSAFDITQRGFPPTVMRSHLTPLPAVTMQVLQDRTISWRQPVDPALYNGRCGETAAANIVTMISKKTSPNSVAKLMSDLTPGTKPKTLQSYLQENAPGNWQVGLVPELDALSTLKDLTVRGTFKAANKRSPLAALIQLEGYRLHWVTIVDVTPAYDVMVNQDGTQKSFPAAEFLKLWAFSNPGAGRSVRSVQRTISAACCQPYTVVYQTE